MGLRVKTLFVGRRRLAVCALLFVAGIAVAGTASAAPGGFLDSLANVLDPLFDGAAGMFKTFRDTGMVFLSIAFMLELFTLVTKFYVKGGASDFVAELFRLFIVLSIPLAMLATWPDLPQMLVHEFTGNMAHIITGGSGTDTSQISTAITNLFNAIPNAFLQNLPSSKGGMFTRAIYDALTTVILFIPLVLLVVATLFALFGPLLMIYLGLIMGPLLVPWIVWKPLQDVGMRWFKYMITMGVAFVVGLVMVHLLIGAIAQFGEVVAHASTDSAVTGALALLVGLLPTIIVMCFAAYMLLKSEHIAAAMVGGVAIGAGGSMWAAALAMGRQGGKGGGGGDKGKGDGAKSPDGESGAAPGGGDGGGGSEAALSKQAGDSASEKPATQQGGGEDPSNSSAHTTDGSATFSKNAGDTSVGAANEDMPAAGNDDSAPASAAGGAGAAPAGGSAAGGSTSVGSAPPSGTTAKSGGQAPFHERFADRVGKMSPLQKAGAFSAAAVLNPVAGVAVGAYAMSPAVRGGVNKAIGGMKSAGSAALGAAKAAPGAVAKSAQAAKDFGGRFGGKDGDGKK